jgi:hypothetical protein
MHRANNTNNTNNNNNLGSVVGEVLPYKLGGCEFETRRVESLLSIYLILTASLGPAVYSASNRNLYKAQKTNVYGNKRRPVHTAHNLTAICEPTVYTTRGPQHLTALHVLTPCYEDRFTSFLLLIIIISCSIAGILIARCHMSDCCLGMRVFNSWHSVGHEDLKAMDLTVMRSRSMYITCECVATCRQILLCTVRWNLRSSSEVQMCVSVLSGVTNLCELRFGSPCSSGQRGEFVSAVIPLHYRVCPGRLVHLT